MRVFAGQECSRGSRSPRQKHAEGGSGRRTHGRRPRRKVSRWEGRSAWDCRTVDNCNGSLDSKLPFPSLLSSPLSTTLLTSFRRIITSASLSLSPFRHIPFDTLSLRLPQQSTVRQSRGKLPSHGAFFPHISWQLSTSQTSVAIPKVKSYPYCILQLHQNRLQSLCQGKVLGT